MQLYQPTITGSLSVSGSINLTGSLTLAGGGTISGTASIATNAITASSADNFLVRNTLTAQTLVVQTITSSVDFVTGSTRFGSTIGNTHVFTGSMDVSGSITSQGGFVLGNSHTISPTGSIGYNNAIGVFIYGKSGSEADFRLYNRDGLTVMSVIPGTQNTSFPGSTTFSSNVTALTQTLTKSSDGIFATYGGNTPKLNLYQFSTGNVLNYGHNFYYDGSNYGLNDNSKMGWEIRTHVGNANLEISSIAAGTTTRTTRLFIDGSNGSIGIGTSSPSSFALLHINKAGNTGMFISNTSGNTGGYLFAGGTGGLELQSVDSANSTAKKLMLQPYGGLVGIGTTDIDAQLKVFSNDAANLMLATTTKTAVNIVAQKQGVGYSTLIIDAEKTQIYSSNSEKFRIDTNGVVKIGNGVSPDDGRSPGYANISMAFVTSVNEGSIQAVQQGINVYTLRLNASGGAVYAGGVRLDTLSDERMKTNITSLSNALDTVTKLYGKKFHLKDEPESKIRYGFIAQELEGVLDEFVINTTTKYKNEETGEEIENLKSIENWGSSWAALLVEAIKELKAEFDAYKATHP